MGKEFSFQRQPFDGTQSEVPVEERREAVGELKKGIQNLFTQHDDAVYDRSFDTTDLYLEIETPTSEIVLE